MCGFENRNHGRTWIFTEDILTGRRKQQKWWSWAKSLLGNKNMNQKMRLRWNLWEEAMLGMEIQRHLSKNDGVTNHRELTLVLTSLYKSLQLIYFSATYVHHCDRKVFLNRKLNILYDSVLVINIYLHKSVIRLDFNNICQQKSTNHVLIIIMISVKCYLGKIL